VCIYGIKRTTIVTTINLHDGVVNVVKYRL
jgi:hypothetical protein